MFLRNIQSVDGKHFWPMEWASKSVFLVWFLRQLMIGGCSSRSTSPPASSPTRVHHQQMLAFGISRLTITQEHRNAIIISSYLGVRWLHACISLQPRPLAVGCRAASALISLVFHSCRTMFLCIFAPSLQPH